MFYVYLFLTGIFLIIWAGLAANVTVNILCKDKNMQCTFKDTIFEEKKNRCYWHFWFILYIIIVFTSIYYI